MLVTLALIAAGACLGGCVSTQTSPIAVASTATPTPLSEPAEQAERAETAIAAGSDFYAETKDASFTVPAVKPGQVDSAFLRKNVAYSTKEPPGTVIVDPAKHYLYHVLISP